MPEGMTGAKRGPARAGAGFPDDDLAGFGGEGGEGRETAVPLNTAQLGLWAFLATLSMLFAGFTSAYLVRRTVSDWQPIAMPPVLWLNTAMLFSSSITLEAARGSMRRRRTAALNGWLLATAVLGMAFLVGQLFAWRQLAAQGIYVPTNPHSSFFYMLTGVHGLHLLGGILALLYALGRAWRSRLASAEPHALDLCATYWHFVDGVWLYLFLLMFAW